MNKNFMDEYFAEFEKKFDAEMFDMIDRCMVDMVKGYLGLNPVHVQMQQQYIFLFAEMMKQKMSAYIDCKSKGFADYIAEQTTICEKGREEMVKIRKDASLKLQ